MRFRTIKIFFKKIFENRVATHLLPVGISEGLKNSGFFENLGVQTPTFVQMSEEISRKLLPSEPSQWKQVEGCFENTPQKSPAYSEQLRGCHSVGFPLHLEN